MPAQPKDLPPVTFPLTRSNSPRTRARSAFLILAIAAAALVVPSLHADAAPTSYTLLNGAKPSSTPDSDPNAIEVGVQFSSSVDGTISAVRFYKATTNTGVHSATLFDAAGKTLSNVQFTTETASGWQEVTLPTPVAISAGQVVTAAYHTTVGHYYASTGTFANGATVTSGPLTATAGTYKYGPAGSYPTLTWQGTNYFVDVVFTPAPPPTTTTTTPPTTSPPTTTTPSTTTPPTTAPPSNPTTFPAPGSVGAKGTLTDVYPAGGVMSIRTPTVLRNVKIHGGLDIYADTELHNVYVEQSGTWWGNVVVRNNASLLAEDCTIKPVMSSVNPARGQDGVLQNSARSIVIRRCEITGTGKGGLLSSNSVIEDSWLHGFTPYLDPKTGAYIHKDSFMTMGGSHIRITRCRCDANLPTPYDPVTNPFGFHSATQTAAILLQPWSNISDVVVESSFLMGGYYAVRMENTQTSRNINGSTSGLVFRNNVWGPPPTGGGYYTYQAGVGITEWTNNVRGDVNGNATTTVVPKPS